MSYFPCDIPYMSEEELIENGIKIHRDASQITCNKCKHYQGVHNVQGRAPCDYWKSGSVLWNEYCSHAEPYKGDEHEDDYDYERASDMRDYCERYEPTYNPEDGSM